MDVKSLRDSHVENLLQNSLQIELISFMEFIFSHTIS